MDWNELWARIEAEMADDADDTEKMRFFPSMRNMVRSAPRRLAWRRACASDMEEVASL